MKSWPIPEVPHIAGEAIELKLFDTADQAVKPVDTSVLTDDGTVGMYVCGITPYDSTHLGHAATYLTFDLIYRQLLANGHDVTFVQNITDVDDPLFERADRDGVDWRELGTSQIDLFRSDMEDLSVLPPKHYIGVMESIDDVINLVQKLLDNGSAYVVDSDEYPDIYASINATEQFGYESNYDRATMEKYFAERGGDPERAGKRDPLDALIWRAAREGEPQWDAPFGAGRPGWHIECSAIAETRLGTPFAIQGGGSDLIFPHHEFSAAHSEAVHHERMAGHYVHTGMIGLDGTKMSKSLGNLVFVSKLTAAGHDPSAIRLGVFASHYRTDRNWSDQVLADAEQRLTAWRRAARAEQDQARVDTVIADVRAHLANDLDTPAALAALDSWADEVLADGGNVDKQGGVSTEIANAVDALLGVKLA